LVSKTLYESLIYSLIRPFNSQQIHTGRKNINKVIVVYYGIIG